jgi:hypothetical protein
MAISRRRPAILTVTLWARKYPAGQVDGRAGIGLNFAPSGTIFRIATRGPS